MNELSHAVRIKNKTRIDQKRVPFDLRTRPNRGCVTGMLNV